MHAAVNITTIQPADSGTLHAGDSATLRHRCSEVGGGDGWGRGEGRERWHYKREKGKRGRDPVSGGIRSDVAGTETLNKREEERHTEMHRQTDGNTVDTQ